MGDLNKILALVMVVAGLGLVGSTGWWVVERHYPELLGKPANRAGGTPASATASENTPVPVYRVDTIVQAHLFGQPAKATEPAPAEAPETKLKLDLIGVLASDNASFARALIRVNAKKEKTYAIGQQIDSTDALLHKIESERVILDRKGNYESLAMTRKKAYDLPEALKVRAAKIRQAKAQKVSETNQDMKWPF